MEKDKRPIISDSLSFFLDSLRICAALTVLYVHAFDQWFPYQVHNLKEPGELSHVAVVIFFVLSGFVITYTSNLKNSGIINYTQARLSRLCSIVYPAILITGMSELLVKHINPLLFMSYTRGLSGIRYILSLLFINEIWFFSAAPPMNSPLWSLSFEFWYYVMFGIYFFIEKKSIRFILLLICSLVIGPRILLMLPVWLAGSAAYLLPKPKFSTKTTWVLFVLGLICTILLVELMPPVPYVLGVRPFYLANQFITDWIIGFFIAAILWIFPLGSFIKEKTKWRSWYRKIADLTFPIYVLHFPLLVLWRSLFGFKINDIIQLWQAMISVIVISAVIGIILEKQRPLWNFFFRWLLHFIKKPASTA